MRQTHLVNPSNPLTAPLVADVQAAASSIGIQIEVITATNKSEIDLAFANMAQKRADAVLIAGDPLMYGRRRLGPSRRGHSSRRCCASATPACCREARRIMLPTAHYPQVRHRNRATSIHPRQYRESYSTMARPCHTQTRKDLGFAMMMLTKKAVPVIAAMLGVAVSTSWAVPVLAGPAQSSTPMQSRAAPLLKTGDLVRLRSGGPVLTVKSVRDGWVICSWLTDYGEPQSGGFPIAMVEGPVTPPPDDANAETNGLSQE